MPLTQDEKRLRKKLVGDAVRRLREHLGVTQVVLGRMIDEAAGAGRRATTDGGAVWGWEKGENLPHEWKRRTLIRIAEKHGRRDLADLLGDPVRNWRALLRDKDKALFESITLLEICALNQEVLGGDNVYRYALSEMTALIRDELRKRFTPERPPTLMDDYQREFWRAMTDEIEQGRKIAEQMEQRRDNG